MPDPRTPVLVAAAELDVRTADAEPIAMMVEAADEALALSPRLRDRIDSVRVVKGIWPYADPGRLVADRLGLEPDHTAITTLGGNGVYDLITATAASIADGEIDAVLVCGAETMRTRRADKAAGRRSPYLDEPDGARPQLTFGTDRDLVDAADLEAGSHHPVNFYAMAESAIRHRRHEAPDAHVQRIAALWAGASEIAADNEHAWIRGRASAAEIATASPDNRLVASPYTKLMTSNIDVDQGAATLICSYETAAAVGVPDDRLAFLLAGTGADDAWFMRARIAFDESPALRIAGSTVLDLAGLSIDDVDHLDLYSCFPSAVQVAQDELGIDPTRPFTTTGGLTFAGGPYNGYCLQALAHTASIVAGTADTALLTGNGGFFTKHSAIVLSGRPPSGGFRHARPQSEVDAEGARTVSDDRAPAGTIEAYTVTHDRDGAPVGAILAVLEPAGHRQWAVSAEADVMRTLVDQDCVGRSVALRPGAPAIAEL